MSRRHRAEPREVLPDPVYGDLVLTKFMNYVMYEGKKSVAEQIVYGALDTVEKKMKRPRSRRFTMRSTTSPGDRSALAPRRRRHLSGAGRSSPRAPSGAGDPLAGGAPRAPATKTPWKSALAANSSTHRTIAATR